MPHVQISERHALNQSLTLRHLCLPFSICNLLVLIQRRSPEWTRMWGSFMDWPESVCVCVWRGRKVGWDFKRRSRWSGGGGKHSWHYYENRRQTYTNYHRRENGFFQWILKPWRKLRKNIRYQRKLTLLVTQKLGSNTTKSEIKSNHWQESWGKATKRTCRRKPKLTRRQYGSILNRGRLITPTVITPTVISPTLKTPTVITPTLINTPTMHPGLYHHILSNRNSKQL